MNDVKTPSMKTSLRIICPTLPRSTAQGTVPDCMTYRRRGKFRTTEGSSTFARRSNTPPSRTLSLQDPEMTLCFVIVNLPRAYVSSRRPLEWIKAESARLTSYPDIRPAHVSP